MDSYFSAFWAMSRMLNKLLEKLSPFNLGVILNTE